MEREIKTIDSSAPKKEIFISHGKDQKPLNELKKMLVEFGLAPVVLSEQPSSGNVPNFVYAIFIVYLILFMSFAVNQVLQYKGVGKWRDYLFGEREYIVLSFIAKTVLVWLVFAGLFKHF